MGRDRQVLLADLLDGQLDELLVDGDVMELDALVVAVDAPDARWRVLWCNKYSRLGSEDRAVEFAAFDANYLEKLRSGDRSTQDHFVSYFSDLIRLKLRSRLNSREAIEDVRQETFARVLLILRKEDGLRSAERLGSFVNSVCNHVLQEQYRSNRKNVSALEEESEAVYVDDKPSPLSILESKDAARIVQQSLADMPERDRQLLRSVLMEERDKDDVCEELGVSREYLRVLVHRAKQSFKTYYISKLS